MTEIILLILGCSLALLFFIWLIFRAKITSKSAALLIDTGLLALCAATIICGLLLRQEKYANTSDGTILQTNTDISQPFNQQTTIETDTKTDDQAMIRTN